MQYRILFSLVFHIIRSCVKTWTISTPPPTSSQCLQNIRLTTPNVKDESKLQNKENMIIFSQELSIMSMELGVVHTQNKLPNPKNDAIQIILVLYRSRGDRPQIL